MLDIGYHYVAVDANGNPLVVYHGTGADISEFQVPEAKNGQVFGRGIYFTSNKKYADSFAYGEQPNVIPDRKSVV